MYPHRIHLRGPWECEPQARTTIHSDGRVEVVNGPLPSACRLNMPCRWATGGLGLFSGRARFRRRFQWPGTIDYYERLWLAFHGADYFAKASLNGVELGQHAGAFDPFEFDVTSLIQPKNELVVDVELPATHPDAASQQRLLRGGQACPDRSGGLWGNVLVEVRREAFLRQVRLFADFSGPQPVLHVYGEVVGAVDHPLELYVLLDGDTLIYQRVPATLEGAAFHVAEIVPGAERWWPQGLGNPRLYDVQVDLIDRASKFDTRTLPFGFRALAHPGPMLQTEAGRDPDVLLEGETVVTPVRIDLPGPVLECPWLEEADRQGKALLLHLPLQGGYATDEAMIMESVRQVRAIVAHLQHHPCILAWQCHEDSKQGNEVLDRALAAAIAELDPTRGCWAS
jgi:beta-galactosidase/beta-glucuronidase